MKLGAAEEPRRFDSLVSVPGLRRAGTLVDCFLSSQLRARFCCFAPVVLTPIFPDQHVPALSTS